MKKVFIFLLLTCASFCMFGEHVEHDGLLYEVLSENELTAQVVGQNFTSGTLVDLVIPSTIAINGKEYTIRKVNKKALFFCNQLRSVVIPSSMQEIGEMAFYGCHNLFTVKFDNPDSLALINYCFYKCNIHTVYWSGYVFTRNITPDVHYSIEYFNTNDLVEQLIVNGDTPRGGLPIWASCIYIKENVRTLSAFQSTGYDFYCFAKNPPFLSENQIIGSSTTLHVPSDAFAAYFQADVWSSFTTIRPDAIETQHMSIDTHEVTLKVGESVTVHEDRYPVESPMQTFSFFVNGTQNGIAGYSHPSVDEWVIKGLKPGSCTFLLVNGECTDTCRVTVEEVIPTVTLNPSSLTLMVGQVATISHTITDGAEQELVYENSNPDVVAYRVVNNKCEVLALKGGEATLTAKTKQGDCIPGECRITVMSSADLNNDGTVDISDVNTVINAMLGKTAQIQAADVNGDGRVDIADVNMVINAMLGKE